MAATCQRLVARLLLVSALLMATAHVGSRSAAASIGQRSTAAAGKDDAQLAAVENGKSSSGGVKTGRHGIDSRQLIRALENEIMGYGVDDTYEIVRRLSNAGTVYSSTSTNDEEQPMPTGGVQAPAAAAAAPAAAGAPAATQQGPPPRVRPQAPSTRRRRKPTSAAASDGRKRKNDYDEEQFRASKPCYWSLVSCYRRRRR